MPDLTLIATVTIFIATYAVVAVGKVPVYRIDRAGAALLGGSLVLGIGVLTPQEAYRAIDFDTITLLLGMMIVVANLRVCGFFRLVTDWIATHVRRPLALLVAIALASGTLSAFLVNDTICLVMTPLVLELVTAVKRNPIPYLLAVATASNIGSVATITGNPQNIIIASLSQIPYGVFAGKLAPVAAIGLVITVLLIALVHRGEFFTSQRLEKVAMPTHHHGPLMAKTLIVMTVMIVLFFLGQPVAKVAIVADHRHGGDLRRQFHPRRLRRQSHCCSAGEGARRRDRLLGLFQGRRAIEPNDDRDRAAVAVTRPFQFFILWP